MDRALLEALLTELKLEVGKAQRLCRHRMCEFITNSMLPKFGNDYRNCGMKHILESLYVVQLVGLRIAILIVTTAVMYVLKLAIVYNNKILSAIVISGIKMPIYVILQRTCSARNA